MKTLLACLAISILGCQAPLRGGKVHSPPAASSPSVSPQGYAVKVTFSGTSRDNTPSGSGTPFTASSATSGAASAETFPALRDSRGRVVLDAAHFDSLGYYHPRYVRERDEEEHP